MDNEIKIRLDNVTLVRSIDGTITIAPLPGSSCSSKGILIGSMIATLMGIVWVLSGIVQLFHPTADSNPGGTIIFGVFATLMFAYFTGYLYVGSLNTPTHEPYVISPTTNIIRLSKRQIPFNDVANIVAENSVVIPTGRRGTGGIIAIKFFLILNASGGKPSKKIELCRKTMDISKTEQINKFTEDILTLLRVSILKN